MAPRRTGAGELIGRGAELALLKSFLDRAASGGDALLLFGDPGIGKTALVDTAAEVALQAGSFVLRASGVEFEADVAFSALHQALLPLQKRFDQLSTVHRRALNAALGLGEGSAPERLVVSNATLMVLRAAAVAHPVVIIVDDLPWLDRASAGVLGFVARRVAGSRLGFLAASRTGEESFFDRADLPGYQLEPLDRESAGDLVDARFPTLASRTRQRVVSEAEGNPLALLELSRASTGSHSPPPGRPVGIVPVSHRLERLFASRVVNLPEPSRWLLLLSTLDGTGDLRVPYAAGGVASVEDLAPAERAGLVYVDQGSQRLAFRHPLIRSTVVELATDQERRRAHRALAELFAEQPDRRGWHLAEATLGTDEQVARLLEEVGHRALRRGDAVGAVTVLARASELSPDAVDRRRRLAQAAYLGADVTGDLRDATRLLEEAQRNEPGRARSLEAATAASYALLNADGDVDTAHRLLVGAIRGTPDGSEAAGSSVEEALNALLQVCFYGERAELWESFEAAIARLRAVPTALVVRSRILADLIRTPPSALDQLDDAIAALVDEADPTVITRITLAGGFVDRLSTCREALWRVIRDGREGGAVAAGITAMLHLAFDEFRAGAWEAAERLADDALELCDAYGYQLLAWPGRQVQAYLAAARGESDRNRALSEEMIRWAAPRLVLFLQASAWHARAFAAAGLGDFDSAYEYATRITPAGSLASRSPYAVFACIELVEAAVRTGRQAEATAHANAIRETGIARLSPRIALLAGAAIATAAPDAQALAMFEQTLAVDGADRWPFDLARVQLLYGERLRRAQAMTESRAQLGQALDTFESLGAEPWAARAANELRATGQHKPRADQRDRDALTPQEREVAELAAEGLTNKQIGQRLFLSHRTVGAHLYRIYPKLGVTSRAALRDALAPLPPGEHADQRKLT